jgi:hypothetical protein
VLILQYYAVLRSILRIEPQERRCLKRCRHCRIFFLTDPRNAWHKEGHEADRRKDLGCPFGCAKAYERQQSTRRSVKFYQEHKDKKSRLNSRRRRAPTERKQAKETVPAAEGLSERWPKPVVEHVRMVVSLIEGRPVSLEEILEVLAKIWRQQGMGRRRRIDHAVDWLHENPP